MKERVFLSNNQDGVVENYWMMHFLNVTDVLTNRVNCSGSTFNLTLFWRVVRDLRALIVDDKMEAMSRSSFGYKKRNENDSDISMSFSLSSWNVNLPNLGTETVLARFDWPLFLDKFRRQMKYGSNLSKTIIICRKYIQRFNGQIIDENQKAAFQFMYL